MKRLPVYTFFAANAISLLGNNLTMIAVPWFVLETTGSAAKMGLVGFFTALPAVLAAFFGGTVVDRVGHKQMSIGADIASGITVALIPLLHSTIGLDFRGLLILVFLSALLDAPGNTARLALLPDVAEASGMPLAQANAVQQMIRRGGMLLGPAIAGGLIAWLGSSNILWLDALTFAISATLFTFAIPSGKAGPIVVTGYLQQLREGLRFIRQDRLILSLLTTVAITNFLDSPLFAVILPVFVNQEFGEATPLGLMISSFGAGAVLGTIFYGMYVYKLPRRITFVSVFIPLSIPFWIIAMTPPLPIVLATLFLAGVVAGPLNPLMMTVFQARIPAEMRGRVFGMITALALIAAPLGMVVAGYLVEYFSVTLVLFAIAVCYVLVTLAQIFNSTLREMDGELSASAQLHAE